MAASTVRTPLTFPSERHSNSGAKGNDAISTRNGLPIQSPARFNIGPVMRAEQGKQPYTCIAWTADGQHLVGGTSDGALRCLNAEGLKTEWSTHLASASINVDRLATHPGNIRHVAAATSDSKSSENGAVAHFDMRSRAAGKNESSDALGSRALALAWHPNGTRIGVGRQNGKFSLYDVRKLGSKSKAVCEKTLPWELNSFAFWGDGDIIVAAYGQGARGGFKVLQADTLEELSDSKCHIMPCASLAACASKQLLATGGNDAMVTVWDARHRTMLNCIYHPDAHCTKVAFSHDGSLLAYSGAIDVAAVAQADASDADRSVRMGPPRDTKPNRYLALDIAEGFADPSTPPQVHRMVPDTVTCSEKDFSNCSVSDLCFSPKHAALAFCCETPSNSWIGLITPSSPVNSSV